MAGRREEKKIGVEKIAEMGYTKGAENKTRVYPEMEVCMVNITKDTIIGDILDVAPQTAPIFLSIGMHCLGCPSSRGETVEEACMVHGVDVDALLRAVNEAANQ